MTIRQHCGKNTGIAYGNSYIIMKELSTVVILVRFMCHRALDPGHAPVLVINIMLNSCN